MRRRGAVVGNGGRFPAPPLPRTTRMNTPSSGSTGAQLAHDRIDRYRSLGAFGKPVYQSHVQLRAMLKAKRGDRLANYFAKPIVDADLGELRWTAEVQGPVRAWHEMSPEEQAERALDLEVVRSGLLGYARELREQAAGQPGGAASFASLLDMATRVPAQGDFLYFVGDQPVIAFWGFENHDGSSVDPSAQAPRYASVPAAHLPPAQPAAPPLAVQTEAPIDQGRRRPWWWWLLWGLLAALLLLALLLGLRGCDDGVRQGIDALSPASAPDAMPPAASEPAASSPLPEPPGEAASMPGTPGEVPGLPGAPRVTASEPVAGGSLDLPASAPQEDAALPPMVPAPAPEIPPAASGPSDEMPPASAPRDELPPSSPRELPPPASAPPPAASGPGGNAVPPLEPPGARDLQLPTGPNSDGRLDFLQGDWKAGDGLYDRKTRQPVDMSVRFGKDGKGELQVRRQDGTTCSGPVTGQRQGGKLQIRGSQSVPCSDGSSYGAPQIECSRERGGQTECFGVNANGSRYSMGMRRQ